MGITTLAPEFEPVRVGMIGVGRHARQVLLPALAQVPELRLTALCTAREETAGEAEQRYGVPTFTGYESMLAGAELDAVLVVGGRHGEAMLAALNAGCHVWCETPAVTDRETAAEVGELARQVGKVVEVGSCLRYAPIYRKLKEVLEDWREESPGSRLFQCRYYPYVGHFYNLLLWLNGPIAEVNALRGESEILVQLRFRNGDLGTVTARRFHNDSIPFEQVLVSGDDGLVAAENGQELRRYHAREKKPALHLAFEDGEMESWSPTFSMPYGQLSHLYLRGYVPELEHFARRVRFGAPSICGLEDMLQTLLVRQAVDISAASQLWEPVE